MTRFTSSIFPLILLIGLTRFNPVFAQTIPASPPEQHPVTSGSIMRYPVEQYGEGAQHSEGILGRRFPNLHGGEAIHLDYVYTCGVFNNARGGMRTKGATAYAGIMEIGIGADTEKLGLWKNGTFYMHSFFSHGRNPNRYIGEAQDVAVFAYETPAQVSEYWYEHRLWDGFLTLRGGKQDAGTDFFYLESTADFINSSSTCVPTTGVPTAPDNAWGVIGLVNFGERVHLKVGVYDAKGDANQFWMSESGDVYSAYQVDYHYTLFRHLPGLAYVGAWYDSSETEMLTEPGRLRMGNYGFSTGFEQMIYRRHVCDPEDLRGLTLFFQYAESKRDRNELKGYWGMGLRWLGLFEARPDDTLGFGVSTVRFSRGFRDSENLRFGSETAYEIFYKAMLTENIALQPVFQYVFHTGGEHRNAFVPGLVLQMIF